ncbi:DUF4185 domain-containing protein [Nocardia callitridis]|uniref:DUF4185 domain-containing protein n=1 Tax=Nocardia callitridis TaxID=648753 RepID=A0ABP9KZD7_9NOCA
MTATFVKNLVGTSCPPLAQIGGTDLGVGWRMGNGECAYLLGDTFQGGAPGSPGWWRSPLLVKSDFVAPDAEVNITRAVGGRSARELIPNKHQEWYVGEVTQIPNAGFRIGTRQWMSVFSVNNWADETWETNCAALYYSDDYGKTWVDPDRRWWNNPDHTDVLQMQAWEVHDGYAYCFSTSNGRHRTDGLYLQRVAVNQLLDPAKYETWIDGTWSPGTPTATLTGRFGEPSVRRIQGTWVLAVFNPDTANIETRTAPAPYGPWSDAKTEVTQESVPQNYGGFIMPNSTLENLNLAVSQWNTAIGTPYHIMQYRTAVDPAAPLEEDPFTQDPPQGLWTKLRNTFT